MIVQLAYPWLFIGLLFLIVVCALWRLLYHKSPIYVFPLTGLFKKQAASSTNVARPLVWLLRLIACIVLALATARLQIVDEYSKLPVQGIDIMLVLDVSGSMELRDDINDKRSRLTSAKTEAIKFIDRRPNDPIGLVIFGNTAASRCPLTLDKKLLKEIINDTHIGIINPDGTVLSTAIAMAVNRLRSSHADSKIMIVLTDGTPSPNDLKYDVAAQLAQKFGIKIYTIGIGSLEGGYIDHPHFGLMSVPTPLNKELLEYFAKTTKGRFFEAKNAHDIEKIYSIIDELEKTEHEIPMYTHVTDIIMPLLFAVLVCLVFEVFLITWHNFL